MIMFLSPVWPCCYCFHFFFVFFNLFLSVSFSLSPLSEIMSCLLWTTSNSIKDISTPHTSHLDTLIQAHIVTKWHTPTHLTVHAVKNHDTHPGQLTLITFVHTHTLSLSVLYPQPSCVCVCACAPPLPYFCLEHIT